jgi:CBS domain-containing protein
MPTETNTQTPVSSLMTTSFPVVNPWDTLGEAVERMTEKEAGSALVVDYGRLVGIITSRDILRAVAGRTHSSEARVRHWMSPDPRVAHADTPASEAALMMVEEGCHHLPVVDDGRAIGVVGMRAVVSDAIEPALS